MKSIIIELEEYIMFYIYRLILSNFKEKSVGFGHSSICIKVFNTKVNKYLLHFNICT